MADIETIDPRNRDVNCHYRNENIYIIYNILRPPNTVGSVFYQGCRLHRKDEWQENFLFYEQFVLCVIMQIVAIIFQIYQ